ncbi:MAG: hypothetical protein O9267_13320 [Flavobacterium sp.]|uniref:hypothetical protein n=1 Tax=Flavobacterium sp. TaxID=239 RepID=UPI0022C37307|nr:hypothetical protein [Flavobacterium sp.]MCZ8198577.1 hypothetical protein [Flavobacterium sp.]
MKKTITLLALFISILTFAQVPQGISYQAIALNSSGNPVVSSNVGIRLSVLDNSANGTVLYTETHTKTTNAQGLFNLVIGQGTPSTGTFSTINWGTNSKFLKVEMDATGGTNYVLVGTTQLLSVPYALVAGKVDYNNIKNNPNEVSTLSFMTSSNAYVLAPYSVGGTGSTTNQWFSTSISGTPFAKSWNSFLTSTNAYVLAPYSVGGTGSSTNQWFSTSISGTPIKMVTDGQYRTGIVTSTNAYVLAPYSVGGTGSTTNQWFSTSISGTVIDIVCTDYYIGILTTTNVYVHAPYSIGGTGSTTNQWFSTSISGNPIKIVGFDGGNGILAVTSTNAYCLAPYSVGGTGSTTNQWFTTTISGTVFQN